jgi:hypothetical protein
MFKMQHVLREGADGGEGTGGAGGVNWESKFAEMEARFNDQNAEIDRLRKHSQKLLDEKKTLKTNLDKFDGVDADTISKMMEQFATNEEARLIAEGKFDEVVNRRTEKTRLDMESRLNELTEKYDSTVQQNSALQQRYNDAVVNNHLRAAAEKAGVLPTAIDDVLARARGTFNVLDNGEIEARDKDGNLVVVGSKPLSPALFVDGLKDTAPHYWPASQSGGANGGTGKGSKIENPFRKGSSSYSITEQARLRRTDPQLAAQLAEQAKAAS